MSNAARIQLSSLAEGTIQVKQANGQLIAAAGATAYVYAHLTVSQQTVFVAETGVQTLAQPLTADTNGQLPGWVAGGQDLDILATWGGVTNPAAQAEPVIASSAGAAGVDLSSAQTLTNKRITNRVVSVTQSATPAINTDNADVASITALAQAITSMTTNLTGTPVDGDQLLIRITDNGSARAITWGASFEASTVALPTTTVISTLLIVQFVWNTGTSKWRCVGVA